MTATDPRLVTVQLTICQPCLDGQGDECHTPGCALYLHAVDIPIGSYRVVAERPDGPTPLLTGIVMRTVNRDGDPWVAIHPDGDLPKGLLRREVVVLAAPTREDNER